MNISEFNKEKRRLFILYKRYINGLEKPDNISLKDKSLLAKYYGLSFEKGGF